MRIGWDLDGVEHSFERGVYDTIKALGLEEKFPYLETFPEHDVCCWYWYRHMNMTDQEFLDLCHKGADMGTIFTGHQIEGGREQMKRLKDAGHSIHIVTDRSFGSNPEVSQKLTRQFLEDFGYEFDTLTFSRDKTVVPTDYFIDDKIENYDALDAVGTKVYLINRRWNVRPGRERRRVNTIEEFVDIVLVNQTLSMV